MAPAKLLPHQPALENLAPPSASTPRMTDVEDTKRDIRHDEIKDVDAKDGLSHAHQKEVQNAELYAAIQATNIPRWSKASLHLYLCIFTAFLCSNANGYDGSLMTALLAMPHYQSTFNSGTTGPKVSVIFSFYTVGAICGAPAAAWVADRFGRRVGMFLGGLIILAGMAIAASAKTIAQFTVGRFVLGLGISLMTICAPAYATEVAPPHWRGRATAFYNIGWYGGAIPAAAITFGTNYINSNLSWQIPLILQAYSCLFVMTLVFFIPESPRYLMANGKEDQAFDFLVKYHGNGDRDAPLVRLEMAEWRDQISQTGADKKWWDYRPLFNKPSNRWRALQIIMIACFSQYCGNGLGYFNTVIYASLGVTSVTTQLGYNLLGQCLGAICAVLSSSYADRVPHRPVLVAGNSACAVWLAIQAALSTVMAKQQAETGTFSQSVAKGALASFFMFGVCYALCYTPLTALVATEAMDSNTRAKGLALSTILVNAMLFLNQFAGPIALANITYHYYWVFVGLDVVYSLCWWLFYVETHGRTLEEMDWVYHQTWPPKAARHVEKVLVSSQGQVQAVVSA
ncbi:hypothetical protein JCM24511_08935 [Saitozyma sp. JCM 24511]|nr:hypothetical protein JCM24511_08935 [Saitozyma sp. JCM 24511]